MISDFDIDSVAKGVARTEEVQGIPDDPPLSLWYEQPASEWLEALPLGNGRLGAMVYGDPEQERIQLNEESLWAGGFDEEPKNDPNAATVLPRVRNHLLNREHEAAEALIDPHMLGDSPNYDDLIRPYQTFCDLEIDLEHTGEITDYRRELALDEGTVRVGYSVDGIRHTREAFVSIPDNVLVVRIESEESVSASVTLSREQDARTTTDANRVVLRGTVQKPIRGVMFEGQIQAIPEGNESSVSDTGDELRVTDADAITLVFAGATNYDTERDLADIVTERLAAAGQSYDRLRQAHVESHRELFRRVDLELTNDIEPIPTDERLAAIENGESDPRLTELYFQYGRYLLIGSSHPSSRLPANLQGIWNESMEPPWKADYHKNINLQMNYWPAQRCNLAECAEPMIRHIDALRDPGARTADIHYDADGFVNHVASDPWGSTEPTWFGGVWPMGAVWLCRGIWHHYEVNRDREFLERVAYPIMRDAAEFVLDYLIENEKDQLVTAPSNSPENWFIDSDGYEALYCVAPTMDIELIHDLFFNCIEAADILATDAEFRDELSAAVDRLPPLQISANGTLQEWLDDYEEADPGHRHISHLYGSHPGSRITLRETPVLAHAARNALERRLDHGGGWTGWSRAWTINQWARFEEGDLAHEHLRKLFELSTVSNLFDLHPPFQIDGNFGGCAGIAEMLLQDHNGELEFLPALPDEWNTGSVAGLKAAGDFEIDLEWENGRLQRAVVRSGSGNRCRIRTHGVRLVAEERNESDRHGDPQVIALDTEPGEVVPFEAEPVEIPDVALPVDSDGFSITDTDETTRIHVPVRNKGTTVSPPTTVWLVDVSDIDRQIIDSERSPRIPEDESHEVTFEITTNALPDDFTQIWAVVDPHADLPDLDRTNNVAAII